MGSGGNARACAAVLTMRCTQTTFYSWLPQRAWVGRNAAMLHGVAMETAGNGGESARQRMCIKFCHFITYCRTPRACKLWQGTQKHSLLMWKNHFTGYYKEAFDCTEWISLKKQGSDFSFLYLEVIRCWRGQSWYVTHNLKRSKWANTLPWVIFFIQIS